jgi:hypothetical protein
VSGFFESRRDCLLIRIDLFIMGMLRTVLFTKLFVFNN